jgi:hypothetical protein
MSDIQIDTKQKASKIPKTQFPSISATAPTGDTALTDFPVVLRGFAEHNTAQVKKNWQIWKSASEKIATGAKGTYSSATKESLDYGMKLLGTASAYTHALLELSGALTKAKTPSEVIEISAAHARKQIELVAKQNRELWSAAQKIAALSLSPPNK